MHRGRRASAAHANGSRTAASCRGGLLTSGRTAAVSALASARGAHAGVDDASGAPEDDEVVGARDAGLARFRPKPAQARILEEVTVSFTAELQEHVRIHHAGDAIKQYGRYPSYIILDVDLSVGRLLTLLEMLQVYRQLSASDIAERLEVSPRTVRRYISGLQDMGIPVEAERGPAGGYRLRRGFKLPPLMLSNDEALVVVIGLLAAQRLGLSASGAVVQGALAKLDRLLPEAQRGQVQAMQDFVTLGLSPVARDHANADTILRLSSAARDGTRVRLRYRSAADEVTERLVDPYGVAFQSGHWYLLSWDHLRSALRTFRLDRMLEAEVTTEAFLRPDDIDVIGTIERTLAEVGSGHRCEVLLDLTIEEARGRVSASDATLEAVDDGTLLRFRTDDLDWAATYLARLECDLVVLQPAALRPALRRLAERLQSASRRPPRNPGAG